MNDIMFYNIDVNWKDYSIHDENNIKSLFGKFRYLSNFHVSVMYEGIIYPTSENAYQAAKINPSYREDFIEMGVLSIIR